MSAIRTWTAGDTSGISKRRQTGNHNPELNENGEESDPPLSAGSEEDR